MSAKVFSFSGTLWTDRTVFYPTPQQFAELYPNSTPFLTAAMSRLDGNSPTLPAPDYKFFEHRAGWRYQYASINDGTPPSWSVAGAPKDTLDDNITLDGVTGFTVDASLLGAVFEVWNEAETVYKGTIFVTAVPTSSTITCVSAGNPESATEAVSALADNDKLYLVTTAHGEETEAPEADSDELEVVWNSAYLERTTVEIGQTLARAALRGDSDELKRLRKQRGHAHKMKMAKGLYFMNRPGGIGGVAHGAGGGTDSTFVNHLADANSKTVRATMGVWSAMRRYGRRSGTQQNYFVQPKTTFTYNRWVEMSESIYQYDDPNGQMKEAYAGPGAISHFAKIGAEGFITASGSREPLKMSESRQSSIGLNYKIVDTPHGPLRLIPDPLLRNTPYHNSILITTPSNVSIVRYEPSMYHTNIKKDNNPRVIKDEFSDFLGLKLGVMEGNTVIHLQ